MVNIRSIPAKRFLDAGFKSKSHALRYGVRSKKDETEDEYMERLFKRTHSAEIAYELKQQDKRKKRMDRAYQLKLKREAEAKAKADAKEQEIVANNQLSKGFVKTLMIDSKNTREAIEDNPKNLSYITVSTKPFGDVNIRRFLVSSLKQVTEYNMLVLKDYQITPKEFYEIVLGLRTQYYKSQGFVVKIYFVHENTGPDKNEGDNKQYFRTMDFDGIIGTYNGFMRYLDPKAEGDCESDKRNEVVGGEVKYVPFLNRFSLILLNDTHAKANAKDDDKNIFKYEQITKYTYVEDGKVKNASCIYNVLRYLINKNDCDHLLSKLSYDMNSFDDLTEIKKNIGCTTEIVAGYPELNDECIGDNIMINGRLLSKINKFKRLYVYSNMLHSEPSWIDWKDDNERIDIGQCYIVYDYINKHVYVSKTLELRDDLYLNMSCGMETFSCEEKRIEIITGKQYKKVKNDIYIDKGEINIRYLNFDFEGVVSIDANSFVKEYSVSFCDISQKDAVKLEEEEYKGIKDTRQEEIRELYVHNYVGWDCAEVLVKYIKQLSHKYLNTVFILQTFNGSGYDNFILYRALCKLKEESGEFESMNFDITYVNNQILNLRINKMFFSNDIFKFLGPDKSLADLCNGYKIKSLAKQQMDHNKIQKMYDDCFQEGNPDKFIDIISVDKDLIRYNDYDTLASLVLWQRFAKTMREVDFLPLFQSYHDREKECNMPVEYGLFPHEKLAYDKMMNYKLRIHDKLTIGSYIMGMYNLWWEFIGYSTTKLDETWYTEILKGRIGGRVDLFRGIKKIECSFGKSEAVYSMDACSLYPYVMAIMNVYYPKGDWREMSADELEKCQMTKCTHLDNNIGFLTVRVDQSILRTQDKPNFLCEKKDGVNNYDAMIIENITISTESVKYLFELGCDVEIKHGIIYQDIIKSYDIFRPVATFMKIKNNEDDMKKNKDPKYNQNLREVCKLAMNCISGKVNEGLHETQSKKCSTLEYMKMRNSMEHKNSRITDLNIIDVMDNDIYVKYTQSRESLLLQQKPIAVGALIYEYSRIYMHKLYSIVGFENCLYSDTDAIKMNEVGIKRFLEYTTKTPVPHWPDIEKDDARYKHMKIYDPNNKVFGSFEDELYDMRCKDYNTEGDKMLFYALQKKFWMCCIVDKNNNVKHLKWKGKGINNRCVPIYDGNKFVKVITKKDGEHVLKLDIYHDKIKGEKKAEIDTDKLIGLRQFISAGENQLGEGKKEFHTGDGTKVYEMFEKLYNREPVYLLKSSFKKIVGNTRRCVELGEEDKYNRDIHNIKAAISITKITV